MEGQVLEVLVDRFVDANEVVVNENAVFSDTRGSRRFGPRPSSIGKIQPNGKAKALRSFSAHGRRPLGSSNHGPSSPAMVRTPPSARSPFELVGRGGVPVVTASRRHARARAP